MGSKIKVTDDFIDPESFKKLKYRLCNSPIWSYQDSIDREDEDADRCQFCHGFIYAGQNVSDITHILQPVFSKIEPLTFIRVKANLLTRTPEIIKNLFHTDLNVIKEDGRQKQWTTAIFYINTNNGYTEFKSGEIVESVENRLVSFPANIPHRGTSCTDAKIRIVINFNYFNE